MPWPHGLRRLGRPSFVDCPVCGSDLQCRPRLHRAFEGIARKRVNGHFKNVHPALDPELRLRSVLADLAVSHVHPESKTEFETRLLVDEIFDAFGEDAISSFREGLEGRE